MFGRIETWIGGYPDWLLGLVFFLALIGVCELGFFYHRRSTAALDESEGEGQETHVLGAALGLLALMIAFTFSMAQGRYDERRALISAEASALESSYLVAQLLDEPGRGEVSSILRRYIAVRLDYFGSRGDPAAVARYERASEALHVELWDATLRAVGPHRTTPLAAMVTEPITRVMELQEERRSARRARVPTEVLASLAIYSLITAYTVGYVMGGIRSRHRIVSTILFALITVSILVTLDLDNPTNGAIRLSPEPLIAAQQMLNTTFSPAPGEAPPS